MYTMFTDRDRKSIKKKEIRNRVWFLCQFGNISARNNIMLNTLEQSAMIFILANSEHFLKTTAIN